MRTLRLSLLIGFLLAACAPAAKHVVLLVDGTRRVVDTQAVTVQDLLREQQVALGDNDRVDPPLFAEVDRSATVTVTRVQVNTEKVTQPIPFERKLVHDETFAEGQMRVLQLGANGQVEITYSTTIEDGKPTPRQETSRKIVSQPKPEVLAVGTLGSLAGTSLSGAIVYLASGNAWVMRNSSTDKRPLTTTGDLDGRVFSLSADSRYLLYSRAAGPSTPALNTLWLIDTLVLGETPRRLPVGNVLYAQLAPDSQALYYSTAEKTEGAPGWKAHNDLYYAALAANEISATTPVSITLNPKMLWSPSQPTVYSWWGTNLAVAPDGHAVAYAFANEIGISEITTRTLTAVDATAPRHPLKNFAPFRTRADWVWVPQVAWSPDSRFVIGAVHSPLDPVVVPNDNPSFEVWAFARDDTVRAPLAKQTGMWAAPVWSPPDAVSESQIAFGVALSPSDSERSRYALMVMDRDGGNKQQIFPQGGEDGLTVVQLAWSPTTKQLVAVRDGDVWLYNFASGRWAQLTANGATALVRWGK